MYKALAYLRSLDRDGRHSNESLDEVEIIRDIGPNDIVVRTRQGITCRAIFNPFVCMYFADDVHAVITEEKT